MHLRGIVTATLAFAMLSCSDPRSVVIPNDPQKWETELANSIKGLTSEEKELVAGYLMRVKVGEAFGGKGVPVGTTIKEAIDGQKEWELKRKAEEDAKKAREAEEARLKKELEERRSAAKRQLEDAVIIVLLEKGYREANFRAGTYSDVITFALGFQNKTTRDVVGVKGVARFSDIFGDEIKQLNVSYDKTIAAGQSVSWSAQADFNQFMDKDKKFRDTPFERLKFAFEPQTILFSDGSKLEVPRD